MKGIQVAIRGLASSGKGLVARLVAEQLSIPYVDIGKLFRAGALIWSASGSLAGMHLIWRDGTTIVCHRENQLQYDLLYSERVGFLAAQYVSDRANFELLAQHVNSFLQGFQSVVVDGRNAGTVFLPTAKNRFELQVPVGVRAHRRFLQLKSSGFSGNLEDVQRSIVERDAADINRQFYSANDLLGTSDFIVVDNSVEGGVADVVSRICSLVNM